MRTLTEVNSLEELVSGTLEDLKKLADQGNTVALLYYTRISAEQTPDAKLFGIGQMRVDLMNNTGKDACAVYEFFWGEND